MLKWNDEEVRVSGKMESPETIDENKVYINDYVTVNVNDESIAKENCRVFIRYTTDYKVFFQGDTYNQKENIKEFASNHNVKAKWSGKVWQIDTDSIKEDKDLVKLLEDIKENYDYSYRSAERMNEDIKEFS